MRFPYAMPIILSVPLAFAGGVGGSYLTNEMTSQVRLARTVEYLNSPQVQEERRRAIISFMENIGVHVAQNGQQVPIALDDLLPK